MLAYAYRINPPMAQPVVACHWPMLRQQLLMQWTRLKEKDVDEAGPCRTRIAQLIQREYGIAYELVENYLRNIERTLPLATATPL